MRCARKTGLQTPGEEEEEVNKTETTTRKRIITIIIRNKWEKEVGVEKELKGMIKKGKTKQMI